MIKRATKGAVPVCAITDFLGREESGASDGGGGRWPGRAERSEDREGEGSEGRALTPLSVSSTLVLSHFSLLCQNPVAV